MSHNASATITSRNAKIDFKTLLPARMFYMHVVFGERVTDSGFD